LEKSVHAMMTARAAPSGKCYGRALRLGAQAPVAKKAPAAKKRRQA
jgi:hypothetical protein